MIALSVVSTGALPVAPHVWFVLLAAAVVASVAVVLAARRQLTAAAALSATTIGVGGVVVIVGAELVAVALVIVGALVALGAVAASGTVPARAPQTNVGAFRTRGVRKAPTFAGRGEADGVGEPVAATSAGRSGKRGGPSSNRRGRLVVAALAGMALAGVTAATAVSATGAARTVTTAPASALALAHPLLSGGALLVDGAGLVLLVLLVGARRGAVARTPAALECAGPAAPSSAGLVAPEGTAPTTPSNAPPTASGEAAPC